jgi:hypothetical protein
MSHTPSAPPVWANYEYGDYTLILSGELDSVWAYLTHKGDIIADCLIITTLNPDEAETADMTAYATQDAPPPITSAYATPMALLHHPANELFRVLWSMDGSEACVAINNQPHAYMKAEDELGYTKAVKKSCAFGRPWKEISISHINQPSDDVYYD